MQIHRGTDVEEYGNSIYRQVGYARCEEHVEIRFTTVP